MQSGFLVNKVIFVTGAASGIGRECAVAYAREGARVVVADIRYDEAQQTVASLQSPGLAIRCDVKDGTSVENAILKTVSEFSGIDAIHNKCRH